MFEQPTIRRRDDGSIDIDFYRQAGLTERHLVMADFSRGRLRGAHRVVFAVIIVGAALYIAAARDGAGWNEASAVTARHNSAFLHPLPASAPLDATRAAQ